MGVWNRVRRGALIALANLGLFAVLFGALELAYRVRSDGAASTFRALLSSAGAPHSALDDSRWVVYDPELGYRLNPAQHRMQQLARAAVAPKAEGTTRVLFLGDSVAFDHPGFVSIAGEALADRGRVEVLNGAVPGYTSYQEVLFFRRHLAAAEPDLVLWQYCMNDNHRFLHRFDDEGRMLLTEEAKARLTLSPPWDALVRHSYILRRIHVGLVGTSRQKPASGYEWEGQADVSIAWKDYSWREYEQNLATLLDLVQQHGARLAIIAFPLESQVRHALRLGKDADHLVYVTKPQGMLRRLAEKYGVPYLDVMPAYVSEYALGRTFYRDRIHLNDEGHQFTALQILRFLEDERLIPF